MKYTKTTMKELTKRYAIVLRKCAILNMLVLAGSLCATPATADVTSLDGLYPDGVVSGNLKYEAGEQVSLNTDSVKVESGLVYADYGSSIQIGNEGHTENVSIISNKRGISVYDENSSHTQRSSVSINATNTINVSASDIAVIANNFSGVGSLAPQIDLNAKIINIESTGSVDQRAVHAGNSTTSATGDDVATVRLTGDKINLTAANGIGISAMSQGRVYVTGDTTIKAKNAILARGDAIVEVNKNTDHVVQMDGDINFNYDKATSGTKVDAVVDVTLSGSDSYWNGNTTASYGSGKAPNEDYLKVSSSTLTLKNGATWNASKVIDTEGETEGLKYAALNNLNILTGNVNIADTQRGIVVDKVNAQGATFSGGLLTVTNELSADNSVFKNSISEGTKGGALFNQGTSILTNSSFEKNTSAGQGGAIYNAGTLNIGDGSTFIENKASQGGAIANHFAETIIGNNVQFVGNTATNAGAISSVGSSSNPASLTIGDNVLFNGNKADAYAGAILSQNANLTIGNNAQFIGNASGELNGGNSGGAIAMDSNQSEGQSVGVIGNNATFSNNMSTKSGGGIYVYESNEANIAFKVGDNATFTANQAVKNGGAIALYGASGMVDETKGLVIGSNAAFSGNTASGDGGAVYVSDFGNKTASLTVGSNAVFENNTATGQGGAIYNTGTVTFGGNTTFANNTANGVANDIHNTGRLTFNGNTSFTGGITGNGDIAFNGDELDIGSSVIQGSSISIKNGTTLRANLLSGTAGFDAATLSGDNLNLILDQGSLGGSLVFAQGNGNSLTFAENNLFDIVVRNGNVVIEQKSAADVVNNFVSSGTMDETSAIGVLTMTEAQPTSSQAQALAAAIVDLAQSTNADDQKKAAELVKATQPTRTPMRQAVTASTQVLKAASGRMAQLRAGRSGGDLSQAKLSPWVRGLFSKNHNSQGDGFDSYTHGFAFGVDAQITEEWLLGLGYARTVSTVKGSDRRMHVNGDNYFVYGKYQPSEWYVESVLNYGHNKDKSESLGLTSHYSLDTYGVQLFSGYQYGIADNYAGIRYTYVHPDKYDNGLNVVNEKNTQVATAVIGTRIAKEFKQSDSVAFKPEFRLAGTYDFKSDNSVANVNVIGGNTVYSVEGQRLHRAALETGIGLTAKYGKMEVSADYDIEWRVSNFAQTGMLKLKYNF